MIVEGPKTLEDFINMKQMIEGLLAGKYINCTARRDLTLKLNYVDIKIKEIETSTTKTLYNKYAEIDFHKTASPIYKEIAKKQFISSFLSEIPLEVISKLINFKEEEVEKNIMFSNAVSPNNIKIKYSASLLLENISKSEN